MVWLGARAAFSDHPHSSGNVVTESSSHLCCRECKCSITTLVSRALHIDFSCFNVGVACDEVQFATSCVLPSSSAAGVRRALLRMNAPQKPKRVRKEEICPRDGPRGANGHTLHSIQEKHPADVSQMYHPCFQMPPCPQPHCKVHPSHHTPPQHILGTFLPRLHPLAAHTGTRVQAPVTLVQYEHHKMVEPNNHRKRSWSEMDISERQPQSPLDVQTPAGPCKRNCSSVGRGSDEEDASKLAPRLLGALRALLTGKPGAYGTQYFDLLS